MRWFIAERAAKAHTGAVIIAGDTGVPAVQGHGVWQRPFTSAEQEDRVFLVGCRYFPTCQ